MKEIRKDKKLLHFLRVNLLEITGQLIINGEGGVFC